ncbi:MAG: murein L,D-transpeptidase catalytic domain family protein [Sediminibacterium sp.]
MKKLLSLFAIVFCFTLQSFKPGNPVSKSEREMATVNLSEKLNINSKAFILAIKGYEKLKQLGKLANQRYLTIADMSQASSDPRLYIIDMEKQELLMQTFVAHGRNSGLLFAKQFSNLVGSFQSSLGFYITGKPYQGKHGKSLILKGVETGINDNAEERAIVLHGADYANKGFVNQQGYLGRSLGCPAVPNHQVEAIIKAIQGASCLFVYAPNSDYLRDSKMIN